MMKSALCGALWGLTLLLGQELLRAQAVHPSELPDAPRPQAAALPGPGELSRVSSGQADPSTEVAFFQSSQQGPNNNPGRQKSSTQPGFPPVNPPATGRPFVPSGAREGIPSRDFFCVPAASSSAERVMSCDPQVNSFARFLTYSGPLPLTARQKLFLAYKNVRDPFNLLTIGGEAGISIGSDSHTAYGPGWPAFGKYSAISLAQDTAGEFFGTFLFPALTHEDPHYYRMPNLPIRSRILHVIDAVVVARNDQGTPMFNYSVVFGTVCTSLLGNLYVPGRQTGWGASAARISVALATDPTGNAITEFLPDIARRININVVLVQRVINRVAVEEGGSAPQ